MRIYICVCVCVCVCKNICMNEWIKTHEMVTKPEFTMGIWMITWGELNFPSSSFHFTCISNKNSLVMKASSTLSQQQNRAEIQRQRERERRTRRVKLQSIVLTASPRVCRWYLSNSRGCYLVILNTVGSWSNTFMTRHLYPFFFKKIIYRFSFRLGGKFSSTRVEKLNFFFFIFSLRAQNCSQFFATILT